MTLPVDPARYATFLGVMAILAATPGPANLFAIATGAQRGRAAALRGVLGMNLATLVWFIATALGLGALLTAFPQVLKGLAFAGAGYVAWLGFQALRHAGDAPAAHPPAVLGRSALRDGFVVQIANPKALVFFAAVLPPFVDAGRPLAPQLAAFAAASIGMDLISMSAYGLGGAALAMRLSDPKFRRSFDIVVGLLFIAIAALMALNASS